MPQQSGVGIALTAMFKRPVLLLVLLAAVSVHAQSTVPTSVSAVLTDGYWKSNGQAGRYRVVVTEDGWDHITNRLVVEWVTEPASREQQSNVVASVEPALPFGQSVATFSVSVSRLGVGCLKISVRGVVSVDPSLKVATSLIATSPGTVVGANPSIHKTCAKSRAAL